MIRCNLKLLLSTIPRYINQFKPIEKGSW